MKISFKNKPKRLQIEYFIVILVSFAIAASVYWLTSQACDNYIYYEYLSEEKATERQEAFVDKFVDYITENELKSSDSEEIEEWCHKTKYVYIQIYRDKKLLYEIDATTITKYNDSHISESATPECIYPVNFKDGKFGVYIIEFTETKYYSLETILSLILACIVALIIAGTFSHWNIKRVLQLSGQVKKGNNITQEITIGCKGKDELAELGQEIDHMRKELIEYYGGEKKAWKANRDLLASLSHDIRTPLTPLMLYSDMLANDDKLTLEDSKKYGSICYEKAVQLKNLTDTLFKYFYAFSTSDAVFDIKPYDLILLGEQLIGESVLYLKDKGYSVVVNNKAKGGIINVDISGIKRVIDNVTRNLEKYANKDKDIAVDIYEYQGNVIATIKNTISKEVSEAESTEIGLKTCKNIIEAFGGEFHYHKAGNVFTTKIVLIINEINDGEGKERDEEN